MSALQQAYAHCNDVFRAADHDRWLAHLFAPEPARPGMAALYAFNCEIARIRELVSAPMPGEVRLQWWTDALEGVGHGSITDHPVAQALLDTIERFKLPRKPLLDLIEARHFDLYDDLMPTLTDLEGYCGETVSSLFRLASFVMADGSDTGGAECCGHAGVAYGLVGLLRAFGLHASQGRIYVPQAVLEAHNARREDILAGRATPEIRAAFMQVLARARELRDIARRQDEGEQAPTRIAILPLALVDAFIRRMEQPDYDMFGPPVERPAWRQQWTLWRQWRRIRG